MKTPVALALAAANLVAGHATFQSFVINGIDQGHHFAVQTPPLGASPVMNPASPDMICKGGKATADFVEIAAGSNITMQWHGHDPVTSSSKDEPIATV
jgi:cellulase